MSGPASSRISTRYPSIFARICPLSTSRTWGETLDLARTHGISAYDAMYLELAMPDADAARHAGLARLGSVDDHAHDYAGMTFVERLSVLVKPDPLVGVQR